MTRDGASRMSSVLGLNARPHSASVLPVEVRAEPRDDLVDQHALLRLVDRLHRVQQLAAAGRAPRAVCCSAFTSFGKQLPP